jgi:hypothetical protein
MYGEESSYGIMKGTKPEFVLQKLRKSRQAQLKVK